MKGLTGGGGLWEVIEDTKVGVDPDGMVSIAQARLRRYARDGLRATAEIGRRDLEPGMTITVNSSMLGISQALFCESMRWTIRWSPFGEIVRIEAELSDAEPSAAAGANYFAKLVELARIGVGGGAMGAGGGAVGELGQYLLRAADSSMGAGDFGRYQLSETRTAVACTNENPGRVIRRYGAGIV
jgi:hypothetical protein